MLLGNRWGLGQGQWAGAAWARDALPPDSGEPGVLPAPLSFPAPSHPPEGGPWLQNGSHNA